MSAGQRGEASEQAPEVLIAVAQTDPKIGETEVNLGVHLRIMKEAAEAGARLVVFPECSLTGYCFESLEEGLAEAAKVADLPGGPLAEACRRLDIWCAIGLLECEGSRLYNSALLLSPEGVVAKYRKTHLPLLGVDRFTTPGQGPLTVLETPLGRLSMLICYDLRFPETSRVVALEGAEVILHLTNLPSRSLSFSEVLLPARAIENHVYLVSANRVGLERGTTFLGRSKVIDPMGTSVAEASGDRTEVLYARITPAIARNKHIVTIPGRDEMDLFKDRRPELYGRVAERMG